MGKSDPQKPSALTPMNNDESQVYEISIIPLTIILPEDIQVNFASGERTGITYLFSE